MKQCNNYQEKEEVFDLVVVTLDGQINFKMIRATCKCHDFIDDLLFNGIYPSTPIKPGINQYL